MNRLRCEEGATLVEFGLSCTILFVCMFGLFAFCIALYSLNFVSNAARDASRYASVRGTSCKGFSDCNITADQLQTYVRGMTYPGIQTDDLNVSLTSTGVPGTTASVTVTYTYALNIPFWPSTGRVLSMSSTSQMVISQ